MKKAIWGSVTEIRTLLANFFTRNAEDEGNQNDNNNQQQV